ncbi:helix-turn-helix transcriptional regulator [Ensifer sp. ENS02]|uniref:helix-turn-helix domain-containing protein n=1 Tax=Ensifer TaxID=106591 RepID=UPI001FF017E0|nr:helix-turn-helix transcriptional regulator [Ensifer sp. ENS02]
MQDGGAAACISRTQRDLRRGIGLSQQEFAKIVGLTRRQIAEKEVGGANPRLETLEKVGRGAWSLASWRSQSRTPSLLSSEYTV